MKKTMFITSVVMVIVMAIALTTSSLAWFTASGDPTVTTAAFQVKATSETVAGLAISQTGTSNWNNQISLDSSGNTGLMPLVPLTKASHWDVGTSSWDFDEDDLLEALLGGTEDQGDEDTSNDVTYGAYMIGNRLGNNDIYKGAAYRQGWYEDTFYITNTATGSEAKAVKLNCTINFYLPDLDANGNPVAYTADSRVQDQYDLDATLNVAVLYATNRFDADGSSADASDDGWALLAYATSQGATTINMGRTIESFANGAAAGSSVGQYDISTSTLLGGARYTNDNVNTTLRPARTYDGDFVSADVMEIRVIAWYDGVELVNNNSDEAELRFGLTFGKTNSTSNN